MGEEQSARLGVGGGAVPLLPGGPQGGSEMRRTSGNVRRGDRTGRTRGLRIRCAHLVRGSHRAHCEWILLHHLQGVSGHPPEKIHHGA